MKLPCGHLVHSSCVLNMARVAAASSRRYQAGLQYPLSTSARRCPICRASLSFDSSPAIASDGESESSPLVAPLPPIVSAAAAGNISNDGALGSVASPSVSLGSEMIRSTFGGRVLVALTNRQPSPLTAGNAVEGASNPGHVRALGDSFLVETQLPLLSTMRLASLSPIGVLQRQNGFRAGTRNLLNVSSANRNSSVEHVVGITMQAPAIVSSTPATTEQFAARDAALSEELDHWYPPVGVGAGIPSRPSNSSTLPAASSSFSQLEVVAAVPMAMITSTTVTPTDVDERRLSLTPLTRGNGLKKRKRESKSSVGIRARMARARTKDATSK